MGQALAHHESMLAYFCDDVDHVRLAPSMPNGYPCG